MRLIKTSCSSYFFLCSIFFKKISRDIGKSNIKGSTIGNLYLQS